MLSGVANGALRVYASRFCDRNYTLPELNSVFVAHSIEWSLMGRDDPWWSVLTNPRFKQATPTDQLNTSQKNAFYKTGLSHVDSFLDWSGIKSAGSDTTQMSVLDFGCGLGRIAFALASRFGKVACVDQSMYHLKLARNEWRGRTTNVKLDSIDFVLSSPDLLGALAGRTFDAVHSVIVLQHMVSPLQTVYIEQLCDALKIGGRGWLHIPVDIPEDHEGKFIHGGRSRTCNLQASMRLGGMQMHFTPGRFIKESLAARGCDAQVQRKGDWGIGGGMTAGFVTFTKRTVQT